MATLYEIDESIKALIDEETGEIADFEAFEALSLERDTKLENIALYVKDLKADAEAYKAEKLSFEEKQRKAENKAESLKRLLERALDGEKFKTSRVECSFRRSTSVIVGNVFDLPDDYLRYSEPTPDKKRLKEDLAAGKLIQGASLEEKISMTIK